MADAARQPAPVKASEPVVAISAVTLTSDRGAKLADFGLGFPKPGSAESVYSFPLQGWAVGSNSPARAVDLLGAQRRLPRLAVSIERPDVAARLPEIDWAEASGFAARLGVVHLPRQFTLELSLLFEDESRMSLAVIEGERQRLPVTTDARLQPLLVTTLGRSGSTWLTWLLGKHPELMDYRSFEYEPRVAGYFTEMLRALTQPASYYQALRGDIDTGSWWLGRNPDQGLPWYASEPAVDEWLGAGYVEELIAFFGGRIDALQTRIATATGKTRATYFIEKFPPVFFAQRMLGEIYPHTKEVFLVRDFRDVLCSILAFEGKRGAPWYRADGPASPEEVVRERLGDEAMHLLASWRERSEGGHLLRYEDLVLDPSGVLSALLEYLGVDRSPKSIDAMIRGAAALDPRRREEHATTPSPRESVGRWRNELDPHLVALCDEVLGEALAAFGYSTS